TPPADGTPTNGPPTAPATATDSAEPSVASPHSSASAPATSEPASSGPLTADVEATLQKILDKTAKRAGVAGISMAVLLDDGSSWSGVTGDRIVKSDTPVDGNTVFSIASITKTFVTAVVMQLVDEGKLSLDDRLSAWVPSIPNARKITIAELLGHTSGVYN